MEPDKQLRFSTPKTPTSLPQSACYAISDWTDKTAHFFTWCYFLFDGQPASSSESTFLTNHQKSSLLKGQNVICFRMISEVTEGQGGPHGTAGSGSCNNPPFFLAPTFLIRVLSARGPKEHSVALRGGSDRCSANTCSSSVSLSHSLFCSLACLQPFRLQAVQVRRAHRGICQN